ncbi:hypothetical protein PC39_02250 [Salinisphaera sp. PC39]|uniref:hypothetical protein n=1 Tax=Salinisphaera sp. PC39 TaxID=1304156 RepID=UPI003341890F
MARAISDYGVMLLLAGVLALTFLVYEDGLSGPYVLDDANNLEPIGAFGGVTDITTFRHFVFGNGSGPTGRPVSMAAFLIDAQYWPAPPRDFKQTNLLLHLLNGLLIFLLFLRLSRYLAGSQAIARLVALITASLWLLHPLNVSTTLYIVQRMTQLSTLFVVLGLLLYSAGRARLDANPRRALTLMTLAVFPAGLLAALSKENGALIFLFFAVLELTVFARPRSRAGTLSVHAYVTVPLLLIGAYFVLNWQQLTDGYAARDFDLAERLMTEGRVVTEYLGLILAPRTWGMGLTHDDITLSTGLLSPSSTALSLLFLLILSIAAILLRRKAPPLSLGILWFLAGHALESTFLPLELYFEHRNYLPMCGPLFAVAYYLVIGMELMSDAVGKSALAAAPVFLAGLFAFQTAQASHIWGDVELLLGTWEVEHPESLRAKRVLAYHFGITGRPDPALKLLRQAEKQHPEDLAVPLQMMTISCEYGREPIHTVDDILDKADHSKITDGLLPNLTRLAHLAADQTCDVTLQEVDELFSAVEAMPDFGLRKRVAAKILFLHAEVTTARKRLDPTVRLLERAFHYQATVSVALRRAVILASAGLYEESLATLEQAVEMDRHRPFMTPSRLPELRALRDKIERQANSSNTDPDTAASNGTS